MRDEQNKSWIAIIPALILYDRGISDRSKILYAIISNLTHEKGFCWASNEYLANLMEVDVRTIQRALKQLEKAGHISIDLKLTKDGTERKIDLAIAVESHMTNMSPAHMTNMSGGDDKIVTHNSILENNNTDIEISVDGPLQKIDRKDLIKLHDIVLEHINQKYSRKFRMLDGNKLKKRLERFSLNEILLAIDNAHADEFHQGNGFKYLTPEFFLRNDGQIDKWLNANNQTNGKAKNRKQTVSGWAEDLSQQLGIKG